MKHAYLYRRLTLLFLLFLSNSIQSANIIFDLGDVLIETKYLQSVLNIGPIKMFSYAFTLQNPFSIHKKLFDFLDSIEPRKPQDLKVTDHHGHLLPPLMCDWLKGTLSYQKLLTIIDQNLNKISNYPERILVQALAQTIFTPSCFATTRYIVPEGMEFVKECKEAGHNVYILSNWDPDSFTELQVMYPEFFNLFDGIIISGDVHLLKPDPAIYHYLVHRYNLSAKDCIFIDDLAQNVKTAQSIGMKGIVYRKKRGLLFSVPGFDDLRDQINSIEQSKNSPMLINNEWY